MGNIKDNLMAHRSATPSQWRAEARRRRNNKSWLRRSQQIAMMMLERMEKTGMTQAGLAEQMGCSQQYVSKVLKGHENLSIETICKIENALQIVILPEEVEMA